MLRILLAVSSIIGLAIRVTILVDNIQRIRKKKERTETQGQPDKPTPPKVLH